MKTYPIQLDDNLHAALRLKAAELRISLKELIATTLQSLVQKGKP